MYKLYGRNNTGATAVEALLKVLHQPFEIVEVPSSKVEKAPAWYLALNGRGEVPLLQLPDGQMMTESAAMMIYLADAHPEGRMAPAINSPARAAFLRWMAYLTSTVYASILRFYYPERRTIEPDQAATIKAKAAEDVTADFAFLSKAMGEGPFLLGKQMSAADIYACMLISWADDVDSLFRQQPKLKVLYEQTLADSVVRAVWQRNGMRTA